MTEKRDDSIWKEAIHYTPLTLKRGLGWFTMTAALEIVGDFFQETLRSLDDRLVLPIGVFSLIFYLFLGAFTTIIVNQILIDARTNQHNQLFLSLKKYTKYVFIETTRALVPILLKSILLLIPGLIEAVKLWFVPYVVQFDPRYEEGKIDALEGSRNLVKGRFWSVSLVLLLTLALGIVPMLWANPGQAESHPLRYIFGVMVSVALEAYTGIVLYLLYERLAKQRETDINNVNSVSLQ